MTGSAALGSSLASCSGSSCKRSVASLGTRSGKAVWRAQAQLVAQPSPDLGNSLRAPQDDCELGWSSFAENYRRWNLIASGTSGQVHLATRIDNGCQLAVKTMPKICGRIPRAKILSEIQQEEAVLRRLQGCPGVIELVDCCEDSKHAYLLLELCRGGNLRQYVERHGTLTEAQLKRVAVQVLTTVQACHDAGILHGDLKPANFCLAKQEELDSLRAIDFGCSQFLGPDQRLRTTAVGSFAFVAPEIIRQEGSLKSDVWSAAIMLYWLYSMRFPFWASASICNVVRQDEVTEAVLHGPICFDYGPWLRLSREGLDFMSSCLTRDEGQRPSVEQALLHPWIQGAASPQR